MSTQNVDMVLGQARNELNRSNIPGALETYAKLIKKGRYLDEVVFDLREVNPRAHQRIGQVVAKQALADCAFRRHREAKDPLGALLALVFGPCGTPILASLLSLVAFEGNAAYGGLLLFAYGVGISVPVVALGSAAASVAARLDARGWRPIVDRATGVLMIALGLYTVATP